MQSETGGVLVQMFSLDLEIMLLLIPVSHLSRSHSVAVVLVRGLKGEPGHRAAMGIMEKIKDIEHEMQRTQKNKGASCTHTHTHSTTHTHTHGTHSLLCSHPTTLHTSHTRWAMDAHCWQRVQ